MYQADADSLTPKKPRWSRTRTAIGSSRRYRPSRVGALLGCAVTLGLLSSGTAVSAADAPTLALSDAVAAVNGDAGDDSARALELLPDGNMITAGSSTTSGGTDQFRTAVWSSAGTVKQTRKKGIGSGDANAYGADFLDGSGGGRVILAGAAYNSAGNSDFAAVSYQYTTNLSTDWRFNSGNPAVIDLSGRDDTAIAVAFQPDGKAVMTGYTTGPYQFPFPASVYPAIVRLNVNGSLDTTFGGGDGIVTSTTPGVAMSVFVQPDGKILVGDVKKLSRFNSDGTPDTQFGVDGVAAVDEASDALVTDIAVDAAGSIAVSLARDSAAADFAAARLNSDGTMDTSFSSDGIAYVSLTDTDSLDTPWSVAISSDGSVTVAGTAGGSTSGDFGVARFTSAGQRDSSFSNDGVRVISATAEHDLASAAAIDSQSRILIAGSGGNDTAIVRIYPTDDQFDSTFSGDGIAVVNLAT